MERNDFVVDDCFVASAIILSTKTHPQLRFDRTTGRAVFVFENSDSVNAAFRTYMAGSPLKVYADTVKSMRVEVFKLKTKHEGVVE